MKDQTFNTVERAKNLSKLEQSDMKRNFSNFEERKVIPRINHFSPEERKKIFLSPVNTSYFPINTSSYSKIGTSFSDRRIQKQRINPATVIQKALRKLKLKRKGMEQLFSPLRTMEKSQYNRIKKILSGSIPKRKKKLRQLMNNSNISGLVNNKTLKCAMFQGRNFKMFQNKLNKNKKFQVCRRGLKSPQPTASQKLNLTDIHKVKKIRTKFKKNIAPSIAKDESPTKRMEAKDRKIIVSGLIKQNTLKFKALANKTLKTLQNPRKASEISNFPRPHTFDIDEESPTKKPTLEVQPKKSGYLDPSEPVGIRAITVGKLGDSGRQKHGLKNKYIMKQYEKAKEEDRNETESSMSVKSKDQNKTMTLRDARKGSSFLFLKARQEG
ncbi:unnamed protein product [Moneuplotes crassus]|uniref:Uncharacterized protein n=1 Tax=Euplotes crassus TaxID=5936 RepID=A0AAD1U6I6_EUPCR|nr:unnamed protein product [Moneuplotes crassus]